MTKYSMTPILSGTRLRADHTTFANVIDVNPTVANLQSFNMDDLLEGDELWEATADGAEVKKGDKWLHITHRNGIALATQGWTAHIHKGVFICDNFKVLDTPTDPPPTEPIFPSSFTMTDPEGRKAEYQFVRVIE